jgi:hypothetical protein
MHHLDVQLRLLLEEAPRLIHEVVKTLVAAVDELTGTRHGVLDLLEREERWCRGDPSWGTIASLSDTPWHSLKSCWLDAAP